MARVYGYRVTLKGFIPVARGDLDAQNEAITLLRRVKAGDLSGLVLQDVNLDTRQTSYDPDAVKAERKQVKRTRKAQGGGQ
jgi:hypothetical protein